MDPATAAALVALPLDPISPRLPVTLPFTPAMAARAGIGRAVLDRLHREGRVRRLLRGVYLDATVPVTLDVRARALRLVVADHHVVVRATAAWLHGVPVPAPDAQAPVPVEVSARSVRRGAGAIRYADRDLQRVGEVRCTSPLRTALDLGRDLAPDRALAVLDGFLAGCAFPHTALMAEVARFGGHPGVRQLRELAAVADGRADGPAESVLRLRWLHGRLPTPTPGLVVGGSRLALGLHVHRFGAVLSGRLADADLRSLSARGWRVVVVAPDRVLRSDPDLVLGHLEREFHLHLLDQVG